MGLPNWIGSKVGCCLKVLGQEPLAAMNRLVATVGIGTLEAFFSHYLSAGGDEAWDSRAHGLEWASFLQDPGSGMPG